jgi:hypothetical protein
MSLAKQIKAVLIDLSGTLHIEDQVTPGAVQALKRYKSFQQNYRLEHKIIHFSFYLGWGTVIYKYGFSPIPPKSQKIFFITGYWIVGSQM